MAVLPLRLYGDPVLAARAQEVTTFDGDLRRLATDMTDTMRDADGVGLAANQVGALLRILTWRLPADPDDEPGPHGAWVNPVITWRSAERDDGEEGCLSIPGLVYPVERPAAIAFTAQDLHGAAHDVRAEGYLARIVQHEVDHLDGILFLDRLAADARAEALARLGAQVATTSDPAGSVVTP